MNEVNKNATFKLLKSSFTNEGLTQIAIDLAKKNTGLTLDAMVNMVNQEIDKLGELLTADIKEKTKKALTTFIKSGKGIEISIKSKKHHIGWNNLNFLNKKSEFYSLENKHLYFQHKFIYYGPKNFK